MEWWESGSQLNPIQAQRSKWMQDLFNFGGANNSAPILPPQINTTIADPIGNFMNPQGYGNLPYSPNANAALPAQTEGSNFLGGLGDFFSGDTMKNLGGLATGVGGLWQAYTGGQQQGLAEDAFDFGKENSIANWNQQTEILKERMEDRNASRYAWSGGAGNSANPYQSKENYTGADRFKSWDERNKKKIA